jgi:Beta-galactosidase trimerisation domain
MNIPHGLRGFSLLRMLQRSGFGASSLAIMSTLIVPGGQQAMGAAPVVPDNAFPACIQFSPVPNGKGWKGEKPPISADVQQDTLLNLIGHGFSVLYYPVGGLSYAQNQEILASAQARGMKVNYMTGGFEMFDREHPPAISVYSRRYAEEVSKRVQAGLAPMKAVQRVYSVFPFQDEPFHAGAGAFDYSSDAKAEFSRRYGYAMPASLDSVSSDPKQWLDLLNFQSETFRDGWRQVYRIVKAFDPRPRIVLTHDSHSTFGAGVKSDSRVAIDDVFHWGGDFADTFIYDIYPYTMFDYRYGEFGKLPKPRISQMHYTVSQLRNVTTTYGKELAFWVGTYNQAWFKDFMSPARQQEYWGERELAYTAIAQGANFLVTGLDVPGDARHWEDFGQGMRVVQKAGPGLLQAPKVKARAGFVFPRSQYLQLQEECFNVGLSFELFLRAFGELDILHEDQVRDNQLAGYQVLVLCDVKLLAEEAATNIDRFVRSGGVVIADCVPQLDEYKKPLNTLMPLFGVRRAATDRRVQEGHWIPYSTREPVMANAAPSDTKKAPPVPAVAAGRAFGHHYEFKVASPRACEVAAGKVRLSLKSGQPALISHRAGSGSAYLLGFCLQDSYFQTYRDADSPARSQLCSLISDLFHDAKVRAHIHSSNPDIEASVRANSTEGYVFIINHEEPEPQTTVHLGELGFRIKNMFDVASGEPVPFRATRDGIEFTTTAAFGSTRLLRISP